MKNILTESFYWSDNIHKKLKIDNNLLVDHILISNRKNLSYTDNKFNPLNQYKHLDYLNVAGRIFEYIMDHFTANIERVELNKLFSIVLNKGQSLDKHNFLDHYNLNHNPDFVCHYIVKTGPINSQIIFNVDDNKEFNKTETLELNQRRFVFFNCGLNHKISKNVNDEPLIVLTMTFDKVRRT